MVHGSVYFSQHEFDCQCGCGFGAKEEHIEQDLVHVLHLLRIRAALPFRITSAARCATHNKNVGGKPRSTHLAGAQGDCEARYVGKSRAADISTVGWSPKLIAMVVELALALGCRIGLAQTFLHVDVETETYYPVRLWNYGSVDDTHSGSD